MAEVIIPQTITVHLGRPNQPAEDVTVEFTDYIKNVASNEIYPTWPESAIRANVTAQISFALNRIYTEYYRSRGYDFDITDNTSIDQNYVHNGEVYDNINMIYVFEDGRKMTWGSDIANRFYGLEEQILDVRVPMVEVTETKDGVKKQVSKKMYPGYVLIEMIMNDETWYVVRNTRGVTGFVGPGSKPVPLSEAEVQAYLLGSNTEKVNVEVDFEIGDTLSVVDGTWKDTVGVVKSINAKKQTVTISVEMFGRETPVEIDFTDVRKMD